MLIASEYLMTYNDANMGKTLKTPVFCLHSRNTAFAPIFGESKGLYITNDTYLDSSGFRLSYDMKIIFGSIF